MKTHLFLSLLGMMFIACGPRHNITGQINGLTNDTIYIESVSLEEPASASNNDIRKDTVVAVDGKFALNIPIERATSLTIYPRQLTAWYGPAGESSSMRFFLGKEDRVSIKGRVDSITLDCTLSGTRLNKDWSAHYQEILPYRAKEQWLRSVLQGKTGEEQNTLNDRLQEVMQEQRACEMNYIDNNPDNPVAALCLMQVPIDSVIVYYQRLGEAARNSIFRAKIETHLLNAEKYQAYKLAKEQIIPGKPAPDFTLKTADGSDFTLSSLRGKYVVLDFWGSWCGWCIKGFPELKACYDRHNGKFEVVGIACNEKKQEKWLAAIEQHKLPWINVINPQNAATSDDVTVRYAIEIYPTKIVINPAGIIEEVIQGEQPGFSEKMADRLK